jgi:hypothetical protein
MTERQKLWLVIAIFVLWGGAVVVTWFRPDYRMPSSLHVIASLVIGGAFAGGAFSALKVKIGEAEIEARTRDDDDDDDKPARGGGGGHDEHRGDGI